MSENQNFGRGEVSPELVEGEFPAANWTSSQLTSQNNPDSTADSAEIHRPTNWDAIRFNEKGLIPAIVQDADTGEVLTLAYMNRQSLQLTIDTGQTHFWSRSRNELWHKGATSGNFQHVLELRIDCDGDAILARVRPVGPACHTGAVSCFYRKL